MTKVTYLFGAGASAKCLPIVSEIPARLENFYHFIVANRNSDSKEFVLGEITYFKIEEDFMAELQDLRIQTAKHQSIDTYAKKLRITSPQSKASNEKYIKLKVILTCFFVYEQLRLPADDRYDAFFASILGDGNMDFAKNLRILSWNYDFQFEKAYSAYSLKQSLAENQSMLRVYPSTLDLDRYEEGFSIFKLNGTTGFYKSSERYNTNIHDEFEIFDNAKIVKQFMWLYSHNLVNEEKNSLLLSFAWERTWKERTRMLIETAKKAVIDTEVLIIIGYSIPFFNREIDRDLIQSMKGTIKKIYIQDKNPHSVAESFASIWPDDALPTIHTKNSVDQFFLPPEL